MAADKTTKHRYRPGTEELFDAVVAGDGQGVAQALGQGADANYSVNGILGHGSMLWWTVENLGHSAAAAVVGLLLGAGANPDLGRTGGYNFPPLVRAAYWGHEKAALLLLQAGAQVDNVDCAGNSAFMVAAVNNRRGLAELLLDWGCDPKKKHNGGYTPAEEAKDYGHREFSTWISNQSKKQRRIGQDVGPRGTYKNKIGLISFYNFVKFSNPQHNRAGAERDGATVKNTFNDLRRYGYDYHQDLSKSQTLCSLENLSKDGRLWSKDSLVLIINSHGSDNNKFLTSDGEWISLNEVKALFSDAKCPQLKNKPKIILINCCRGSKKERVADTVAQSLSNMNIRESNLADAPSTREMVDLPTHMAVVTSVSEGVVSLRREDFGSFFIQYFCEAVRKNPRDELSVHVNVVADRMKKENLPHPTIIVEFPFRKFVF